MTSLQRRLPGVRFEVPSPALREALPRMDIAFFVGFTAAGPVDLPVAVEGLGEFEAVFGGEIRLARDAATGADVSGLLHPCVRGFFSAGGRRCWVVRVAAATARTTVFPLANMLLAHRTGPGEAWLFEPALIAARSPGSWADGLGVATRLSVQLLQVRPVGGYDNSVLSVDVLGPPALALRAGELLRFSVAGESQVHARIAEMDAPASDPGGRLRRRVRLRGLCGLRVVVATSPCSAVTHLGYFEPGANDVYIFFGRFYAAFALFAKAMQHKYGLGKFHCVHSAIGAIHIVFHQLQHACTTKALEHFGRIVFVAPLREVQRMAKELAHLQRQGHQVFFAAANPR